MKRVNFNMFGKIWVVAVILLGCVIGGQAQPKSKSDKRNVLDYYKLLPSNLLDNPGAMARLSVRDLKNGYLKIEGAFEGYVEAALFRRKDGSGVLMVGSTECGPVCGTDLKGYEYADGEMREITEQIMPELSEDDIRAEFRRLVKDPEAEMISFIYGLPRFGRTIRIEDDDSGRLIYSLTWKNDRFVINGQQEKN